MLSPVSVLAGIARALNCDYSGIEAWLAKFYGEEMPSPQQSPEKRLAAIRKRLNPGEGQSVIASAVECKAEFDRANA